MSGPTDSTTEATTQPDQPTGAEGAAPDESPQSDLVVEDGAEVPDAAGDDAEALDESHTTDDPTPAEAPPEEPGGPVWIPAEHGQCPICEAEFDNPADFAAHLASEHDLHDDEGTATEFKMLAVAPPPPPAHKPPAVPGMDRAERPKEAPTMDRPVGLLAFVGALVIAFFGLVAMGGLGSRESAEERELALEIGLTDRGDDPDHSARSGRSTGTDGQETAVTDTAAPATTAPAPKSEPVASPPTTAAPAPPTTAATAPTTTAPPPTFAAPTTTGARIDSCQREKENWRVTYSWSFVGGRLWKPISSYKALGGGKFNHTIVVPRRDDVPISVVFVVDPDGAQHAVTLKPALNTSSC